MDHSGTEKSDNYSQLIIGAMINLACRFLLIDVSKASVGKT